MKVKFSRICIYFGPPKSKIVRLLVLISEIKKVLCVLVEKGLVDWSLSNLQDRQEGHLIPEQMRTEGTSIFCSVNLTLRGWGDNSSYRNGNYLL